MRAEPVFWISVGMIGQAVFFSRFLVQWIASEKAKRSVVPDAFWYFSILGGSILFIYAIWRQDPVFILGQGAGLFIYLRNIQFIRKAKNTPQEEAMEQIAEKTSE